MCRNSQGLTIPFVCSIVSISIARSPNIDFKASHIHTDWYLMRQNLGLISRRGCYIESWRDLLTELELVILTRVDLVVLGSLSTEMFHTQHPGAELSTWLVLTGDIKKINAVNWWCTIYLALKMTSAQFVETSVNVTTNSPSRDYSHS